MNEFDVEAILRIKARTLETLADMAREPKPTYKIDGAVVSWNEFQERALKTVDWCDAKIRDANSSEFRSQGVVD